MELDEKFVRSEYLIQDLEQFREENGFIDLKKAGISFTDESREIIGNPNRIKNWVNFNGTKVLIKGEAVLEEEKNYGIYAELIVEEIAKSKGVPTAHYDLIKMLDENGNEVFGVLSESIVDTDKEESLVSLHSIIGDEPVEDERFLDVTSLEYTEKKLREVLILDGYDEEQIEKVIIDYKKRLAFGISVINTDGHTQNVAFIKKKVDGKDIIELSANFDSESCLMLDNDQSTVKMLLEDYEALKESVDLADPRIGVYREAEDGGHESLWKDTIDELCYDDEVYDYYADVLSKPLDMDEILDNVEKRIHAPLPENVRLLAKYAYKVRNEEITRVIEGEALEQGVHGIDNLLKLLINRGTEENIRTGELINVGQNMERDMNGMESTLQGDIDITNDEIE